MSITIPPSVKAKLESTIEPGSMVTPRDQALSSLGGLFQESGFNRGHADNVIGYIDRVLQNQKYIVETVMPILEKYSRSDTDVHNAFLRIGAGILDSVEYPTEEEQAKWRLDG